jgi:hypothetical protein
MKGRRLKLVGILAMLVLLCFAFGLYLFVMVHHTHLWSLFVNVGLLFLAFLCPACCFGYNMEDPALILHSSSMTEQSYLNWRDAGYATGFILYVLSYIIPAIAFVKTDGRNPNMWATMLIYTGNACFGYAFALWFIIFIREYS